MQRADHGELQSSILSIALRRGSCTVRDVHGELSETRDIAYTTVLTVMTRLSERGVLSRETRGNAGVFTPARSDDRKAAGQVVEQLLGRYGAVAVNEFVQQARSEPELYEALMEFTRKATRGK